MYQAMHDVCSDKHGKGWSVQPVEFRLTGVRFEPLTGGGARNLRPRNERAKIHYGTSAGYKTSQTETIPLAHFEVRGYWVFRCIKAGQKPQLYALATDYKVKTLTHSPYDRKFGNALATLRTAHRDDKNLVVGRVYDRPWTWTGPGDFKGYGPAVLRNLYRHLKVMDDDKAVADIPRGNIIRLGK
jgi:hypothetical protein